jgi:hypothetical protein
MRPQQFEKGQPMSGSSVFPLRIRRPQWAPLPGKFQAKGDSSAPFCLIFILSQIIWYSVGLSLIYDVTERLLHWPHLAVAGAYGGLLVASAWLSRRAVKMLSIATLLVILSVACQFNFMNGFVKMLAGRFVEYSSWVLVMTSSVLLGCVTLVWVVKDKKINLALWIALTSFTLGCAIAILPEATVMHAKGADVESILASQGASLIWLAHWGMPMRTSGRSQESMLNKMIARYARLPLRTVILTMGALSYIVYEWACQSLSIWLQALWLFFPVIVYFCCSQAKNNVVSVYNR